MKIVNKLISFVLVFTFIFSSLVFVSAETTQVDAKELGKKWGTIYGYVNGHKDKCKDLKKDSDKRFSEDEKEIYEAMGIEGDSYSKAYREDFIDTFEDNFTSAYSKGYAIDVNDYLKDIKNPTEEDYGKIWGTLYGSYNGKSGNNYIPSYYTSDDIKENYGISTSKPTLFYDSFWNAYTKANAEAYKEKFSNSTQEEKEGSAESNLFIEVTNYIGYYGFQVGSKTGSDAYNNGKTHDTVDAYQNYVKVHDVLKETDLYKMVSTTITEADIKEAFFEGFCNGYNDGYLGRLSEFSTKNSTYLEIGTNGLEYTIDGIDHVSLDKNNLINETYLSMNIKIPANSAYGDQFLRVYEVPTTFRLAERYLPVGTVFYVGGSSDYNGIEKNSIKLRNDWTISFPFTGSYRAGIYKKEGNKWIYQQTVADGETLTTTIPAGEFTDGQYTVIVDDGFVELSDVYSSWASESLEVFMRRNLLEYNTTTKRYYPEEKISRGEFSNLLKNYLIDEGYPDASKTMNFKDVPMDSKYYSGVRYVYGNGYINGVSDTEFNVNGNLTYKQFQVILSRILGYEVSLTKYFEEMKNEKFYMSKGEKDMNNYMSKSEVVYILYSIWK